jgi:hypothetical protein
MGTASLTDLSGTTNAATVLANDYALVDDMLLDLDPNTNVTTDMSAYTFTTYFTSAQLTEIAALQGGGTVGSPEVSAATDVLMTFKVPSNVSRMTAVQFHAIANNVATLDGSHYWTFQFQTATSRTGTWTTQASLVIGGASPVYEAATTSFSTAYVTTGQFWRVRGEDTGGADTDIQITVKFKTEHRT